MSSVVHFCCYLFRRHVGWSNSRQSWQERIAFVCWLACAIGVWWFWAALSLTQEVVLSAVLLLALVILMRRGWIKLFGPVLVYDMVRTARRPRYRIIRTVYGLISLFGLLWVYWSFSYEGSVPIRRMPEFAETFFFFFMVVQFAFVALLTPAYTAAAIADEKERHTLDFILATDVRNHEIVLSKFMSRLGNVTLLILTGLPALSLMELIGGIDPNHVLAGFLVTGLTGASLAALSILWSVQARKSSDAIILTYLSLIAYVILGQFFSWLAGIAAAGTWTPFGDSQSITFNDLVDGFNAGNLVAGLIEFRKHWGLTSQDTTLMRLVRNFAIFHSLVIVACMGWSVWRSPGRGLVANSCAHAKNDAHNWHQAPHPHRSSADAVEGSFCRTRLLFPLVGPLCGLDRRHHQFHSRRKPNPRLPG